MILFIVDVNDNSFSRTPKNWGGGGPFKQPTLKLTRGALFYAKTRGGIKE